VDRGNHQRVLLAPPVEGPRPVRTRRLSASGEVMAEKQQFLDLWIVESNTVYKAVPYTVVTDWMQQGRLLENDRAKPTGLKDWQRLGDLVELRAFLPKAEPFRADDQAEALEAVHLDFGYKKPTDEEDDDVDMIPLIDVSLVLLVFFMLTASTVAMASYVNTPATDNGQLVENPEGLRIDITLDENDAPVFALGVGDQPAEAEESNLHSVHALLARLRARLSKTSGTVELVINAEKTLKAKVPRDLLLALRVEPFRSKISTNYFGVTDKEP
jgi:biopolymer transport protein ExbD